MAVLGLVALVAMGCTATSNNRADEIANATATVAPTAEPTAVGDPGADGDATEEDSGAVEQGTVAPPTPVPTPGWVVVEGVDVALNVREGPGTDNPILFEAPLGFTMRTTGNSEQVGDGLWLEVDTDQGIGWAFSAFLVETVRPTPTPLATPTPLETPTPEPTPEPPPDDDAEDG